MPYRSRGIIALTFPQTRQVHEAVAKFLTELRDLRRAEDSANEPVPYSSPYGGMRRMSYRADPRRDALVRGNNQFALDLYTKLARETNGNLLVSPYCISGAVALAYTGARGQTAREIGETMHFIVRQEDVPDAFRSLRPGMIMWGPDALLTMTNQFWGQHGIEYRETFQKTLNNIYWSGIKSVDFSEPGQAAQAINDWTVAHSRGSIVRLANPGDFTTGNHFVVASAVRFDGKWSKPFSLDATRLSQFANSSGTNDVALMHLASDKCRYAVVDGIQVLEKTYGNGDVSMVVLLPPDTPTGLADLEATLNENALARWLAAEDATTAEVYLPHFKLESAFNLRRELELLGMGSAFQEDRADFSGISENQKLALSGVIHKAFVQIDEQGPRPAPGMDERKSERADSDPQLPVFRADRPFLFVIRDTQTGSIVFISRVVRPEPANE
jgi:serpin B